MVTGSLNKYLARIERVAGLPLLATQVKRTQARDSQFASERPSVPISSKLLRCTSNYSWRNVSAGLSSAARMVIEAIVAIEIISRNTGGTKNICHPIAV